MLLGHAFAARTVDVSAGPFEDGLDVVAERLDEVARHPDVPSVGHVGVFVDLAERRTRL